MTPISRMVAVVAAVLAGVAGPFPLAAQPSDGGVEAPFADARARHLWQVAVSHRLGVRDALVEYVAVVKQRMATDLRMPLKDRTLYRAEGATRVFWTRDGNTVVQVLGARERTPVGAGENPGRMDLLDVAFDPLNDQLLFGLVEVGDGSAPDGDDFWFEHPLEPRWRSGYRFATGDSIAVTLPDGRRLEVVELEVVPTVTDVHRVVGSLWIEPESGALVRAVYRLSDIFDAFRDVPDLREEEDQDLGFVPGMFKPWTFELSLVAVDYAWWEGDVWLPRTLRAEGMARAGVLRAPTTVELGYRMESVVTEEELATRQAAGGGEEERHFATRAEAMDFLARQVADQVPYHLAPGFSRADDPRGPRRVHWLMPDDPAYLAESPHLPPPVWEEDAGFATGDDLREWKEALGDLPEPPARSTPWTLRWGLQRTDLVRYNRVEGLSVGARAQVRPRTPLGPLSVTATVRLGTGDRVPNGHLNVTRETLDRRVTGSVFHELATVDEGARHLALGNTATALLFGRDDGDYYRRSGASLSWSPPSARRQGFRVRAYAEHHRPVAAETDFALWHLTDDGRSFRRNPQARRGWEMGGLVTLRPWWGTDPRLVQGGLDLTLRGARGDWAYARASLEGRLAVPLFAELRLGLEGGGGTSWGDPPLQRHFLMGGAGTLRGYAPGTVVGTTYLRVRGELARHFAFGAVTLFSDAAWGAEERRTPDAAEIFWSVGAGISMVDGLIRLDGAWGLREPRDFRLELYLDGIL